ncbi:DNA polymerase Y family protein [Pseudohalocynthiibacter aestuariivivens]|jgi:protein ImuB|uniref:DNA-directed DNA polymerase n=1 Tax=Pseudohalocynthiibacter aestuariivivens TaxID=1591409 RepID=A0ABV5JFH0_9RHOB|nr:MULTISPECIES: DNA polymerase Y family protein [Pseudohalocynthiibacter]MBS9717776.1 DNA polymerase Y family protein [Pseudohalocynthiibacter aestuariivivens]MCK0103074.1 DNA polymerase Y family protein [Pseudohalocynthiibacter sp. F2068]
MQKRVVSLWFPRLASDRFLRARTMDAPFALTLRENNTERLYCLNMKAEELGLRRGMGFSDARALFPDLQTCPADPRADSQFLRALARWAARYCPWVGQEGTDGLVLNITGSAHLFGGEAALLADMRARLSRAGLTARLGLADTRGGAWALARFGEGVALPDKTLEKIAPLPVAGLRLSGSVCDTLQRLGINSIADLHALPRATLTRRFGREPLLRLDQALGDQPEDVSPLPDPPRYSARLSLPDPIGLASDVMAGLERLLGQLCARLTDREQGARTLQLTLRRVDQASQQVELRLARPLRDPARILPLFQKGVETVDAGFGIDQLRLEATLVEDQPLRQISHASSGPDDKLDDLITRLGSRIGLDNIIRFLPADSHIPERSYITASAAYSAPGGAWPVLHHRPLRLFPPEQIAASGRTPPRGFRWRRMALSTARATGPERIAPEWWLEDEAWRTGLRDYWMVETRQGRRLWLFHTPQNPGWYVQGEFA